VPPARARTVDIVALQFAAADQTRGWFSGPGTFAETGAKEVEISAILDDGRICLTALPFSRYLARNQTSGSREQVQLLVKYSYQD